MTYAFLPYLNEIDILMLRSSCRALRALFENETVMYARRKAVIRSSVYVLRYLCRNELPKNAFDLSLLACNVGNADAYLWLNKNQKAKDAHVSAAIEGDQPEMLTLLLGSVSPSLDELICHAGGPKVLKAFVKESLLVSNLANLLAFSVTHGNKHSFALCYSFVKGGMYLDVEQLYAQACVSNKGEFIRHLFDQYGFRPLPQITMRVFITTGDVEGVEWACANGCTLGNEELKLACQSSKLEVVRHLINVKGMTPLDQHLNYAIDAESVEIFAFLLQKGAQPNHRTHRLIYFASRQEEFAFQLSLLSQKKSKKG